MTGEDRIAMCIALGMTENDARSQLDEIASWTEPVTVGGNEVDL